MSGSAGGPGQATASVYPTAPRASELACLIAAGTRWRRAAQREIRGPTRESRIENRWVNRKTKFVGSSTHFRRMLRTRTSSTTSTSAKLSGGVSRQLIGANSSSKKKSSAGWRSGLASKVDGICLGRCRISRGIHRSRFATVRCSLGAGSSRRRALATAVR